MMRFRWNLTEKQARSRFYSEVWPHAATVLRSAQMLARNSADADDLTQETMLKAYQALERLEPGSNPRGWLLTILRNCWIDRFRSANAHPTVALGEIDVAAQPVAEAGDQGLWSEPDDLLLRFGDSDIIDALHALPDEIRWTLLLVDVQDMAHAEAAEVLKVPVGTIKSRAHRGRAMLRDLLTAQAKPSTEAKTTTSPASTGTEATP